MGTDSLYYIMDYSGHYYRTNQANQLVAAAGEQEATVFTLAQANRHIGVGKKASFYCMVPIEEQTESITDEVVSPIKELTYDEVTEPVEKKVASYDLSEMDWAEYLTHFTYLVEGLKDYKEELTKKHSDIDQKICDVLHYIELCETDENEAADLVELLRVCRENRRDIKDELQRIEYFQNNFGTNANVTKAKQALKCIMGLETRKYKPRKYEELFENCILKDRRLQRDDISEDANCNVTQGYKIFKRLKELRLEKKAKNRELNCLYALTDYIDCQSLADVCEDNLAEVERITGEPEHSEVTKMQPAADEQEENIYAAENIEDMVG